MVRIFGTAAAMLLLVATPLSAQPTQIVSAQNPQGLVDLLELTGYEPVLGKDKIGDPKIDIKITDFFATIYFYGCDDKTHDGCDSVQFQASFDRKDPWPAKDALDVARKWRFGAVYLDDEGDPVVSFDIVTGEGIASKVFLEGLRSYGDTLDEIADMVFPDDGSQDTTDTE